MPIPMIISGVSGLYGLLWLIFAFVEPPGFLSTYFRAPMALYFLPDRGARALLGIVFLVVIPMFANVIASMFL